MMRNALLFITLCFIQIGCTTEVLKMGADGKPLPSVYRINVADSIKIQFRVLDSINAIRKASQHFKNYRLQDCKLYVTLEPCHMCAKAISDARIDCLIFATKEPKTGSIVSIDNVYDKSLFNHKVKYKFGLKKDESSKLLKDFFKNKRS